MLRGIPASRCTWPVWTSRRARDLENVVLHGLLARRDPRPEGAEVHHWRTAAGLDVDFVVEARVRLLPVEVESSVTRRLSDAPALRRSRADYGS